MFDESNGRFSMSADGFILFASRNGGAMDGVSLRYMRFDPKYLDDAQVRSAQHTSVFSQWQAEAAKASKDFLSRLSLKPLYKRPPAVWQETAYVCEFGDACVEGTGLDGSTSIYGAIRVFSFVVNQLWEEQQASLVNAAPPALAGLAKTRKILDESAVLAREYELAQKNPSQLINFVRKFRKRLEAMETGDAVIVPAGFSLKKSFSPFALVLERTSQDDFMLAVVNPGLGVEQYHMASATTAPPKIQSRLTLTFENVGRDGLLDDAWWLMLWRTGFVQADINTPDKFYNDLLPLLLKKPLESAIAENLQVDRLTKCSPFRTNQRSKLTGYRCVRESWLYLLSRFGASPEDTRQMYFTYQQQWLKMLLHDLHCAASIDESDCQLIRLSMKQVAHVCTKKLCPSDHPRFLDDQLEILRTTTQGIEKRLCVIPVQAYKEARKSILLDEKTETLAERHREQTYFERFLRLEDISGLAGARTEYPDFVPVDFLLVTEQATTLDEAIDATRWADKLCTLCSAQSRCVKNAAFYKVALLQHLFTKVLPAPTSSSSKDASLWRTPMRYGVQLDLLLLFKRLFEHFLSSSFAIITTREFDAVKIVVGAVIVTLSDVVLRAEATDIPSEVSQVLRMHNFGITMSPFDEQSETIVVTMPELNIARTAVLDYWADLAIEPDKCFFNFNQSLSPDEPTLTLLKLICREMGFPYSSEILPLFVSGKAWQVLKNFPEFEFFRDVVFFHKYVLGTDKNAFPRPGRAYSQKDAELIWAWNAQEFRWQVSAFRNPDLATGAKGHRWPTFAVASRFTSPHKVLTEDDAR